MYSVGTVLTKNYSPSCFDTSFRIFGPFSHCSRIEETLWLHVDTSARIRSIFSLRFAMFENVSIYTIGSASKRWLDEFMSFLCSSITNHVTVLESGTKKVVRQPIKRPVARNENSLVVRKENCSYEEHPMINVTFNVRHLQCLYLARNIQIYSNAR